MKTLSNIKKDMEFNLGLTSLIEVLKNIAVSQYHALEHKLKTFERFPLAVESFFELIDLNKINHPFLSRETKSQVVLAVTSDSGLLGGLNMQVVTGAILELEKIPGKLIVVGERGKMYAAESNIPFVSFGGVKDEERYGQAMQMRDYLITLLSQGNYTHFKIVYPHPVSFTVQHVETVPVLPFHSSKQLPLNANFDILLESEMGDIVEYLVYLWIGQKLFEVFGLSRLSEFAARYVHLEESSQKLKDMDNKLRLQYFRIRHELIDRSMRELFSARLLYAA